MTHDMKHFSYTYFSSIYFLWWGVCSDLWPIILLACPFSYCWVLTILCMFWITVIYQICLLQLFSPSLCLVFLSNLSFWADGSRPLIEPDVVQGLAIPTQLRTPLKDSLCPRHPSGLAETLSDLHCGLMAPPRPTQLSFSLFLLRRCSLLTPVHN